MQKPLANPNTFACDKCGELTLVATDNLVIERDDVLIVQSDKIVKKQQTDKKK